jgi:hypothetical protein
LEKGSFLIVNTIQICYNYFIKICIHMLEIKHRKPSALDALTAGVTTASTTTQPVAATANSNLNPLGI